jgi:hypothetical protein
MRQTLFVFKEGEKYKTGELTTHERITIELLYQVMMGCRYVAVIEPTNVSLSSTNYAKKLAILQNWSHDAICYPGNTIKAHNCKVTQLDFIPHTTYRICVGR